MKKAFVGVPCDIEALRKIQAFFEDGWIREVVLQIGLFCRENWAYTCFRALVEDDYGVKMEDVKKFDIKKGNIIAYQKAGKILEFPLEKSRPYVRIGCQVCMDFTAELADISVGAVGTPLKWSTVVVRTKEGLKLVEGAAEEGYIELKPIEEVKPGVALIKRIDDEKKKENLEEAKARDKKGISVPHIKTLEEGDLKKVKESAKGKDFKALEGEIVDTGLCIACGACEVVCPEECVKIVDQRPILRKECKEECYECYLYCPRTSLPLKALEELVFERDIPRLEGVGKCLKTYAARARDEDVLEMGQDGGAVTALLAYALDKGIIDEVVAPVKGEDPWRPEPFVSKNKEDLKKTSGTIYSHSTSIPLLRC
jgi:coenzyme F420 hydrogenase subunit beta